MFCEKTCNAAAIAAVLAFLPVGSVAWSQTPAQETQRDLSNYATIVVGYDVDGRCQVLNKHQRANYLQPMRVIRHASEKKGLFLLSSQSDGRQCAGRCPAGIQRM